MHFLQLFAYFVLFLLQKSQSTYGGCCVNDTSNQDQVMKICTNSTKTYSNRCLFIEYDQVPTDRDISCKCNISTLPRIKLSFKVNITEGSKMKFRIKGKVLEDKSKIKKILIKNSEELTFISQGRLNETEGARLSIFTEKCEKFNVTVTCFKASISPMKTTTIRTATTKTLTETTTTTTITTPINTTKTPPITATTTITSPIKTTSATTLPTPIKTTTTIPIKTTKITIPIKTTTATTITTPIKTTTATPITTPIKTTTTIPIKTTSTITATTTITPSIKTTTATIITTPIKTITTIPIKTTSTITATTTITTPIKTTTPIPIKTTYTTTATTTITTPINTTKTLPIETTTTLTATTTITTLIKTTKTIPIKTTSTTATTTTARTTPQIKTTTATTEQSDKISIGAPSHKERNATITTATYISHSSTTRTTKTKVNISSKFSTRTDPSSTIKIPTNDFTQTSVSRKDAKDSDNKTILESQSAYGGCCVNDTSNQDQVMKICTNSTKTYSNRCLFIEYDQVPTDRDISCKCNISTLPRIKLSFKVNITEGSKMEFRIKGRVLKDKSNIKKILIKNSEELTFNSQGRLNETEGARLSIFTEKCEKFNVTVTCFKASISPMKTTTITTATTKTLMETTTTTTITTPINTTKTPPITATTTITSPIKTTSATTLTTPIKTTTTIPIKTTKITIPIKTSTATTITTPIKTTTATPITTPIKTTTTIPIKTTSTITATTTITPSIKTTTATIITTPIKTITTIPIKTTSTITATTTITTPIKTTTSIPIKTTYTTTATTTITTPINTTKTLPIETTTTLTATTTITTLIKTTKTIPIKTTSTTATTTTARTTPQIKTTTATTEQSDKISIGAPSHKQRNATITTATYISHSSTTRTTKTKVNISSKFSTRTDPSSTIKIPTNDFTQTSVSRKDAKDSDNKTILVPSVTGISGLIFGLLTGIICKFCCKRVRISKKKVRNQSAKQEPSGGIYMHEFQANGKTNEMQTMQQSMENAYDLIELDVENNQNQTYDCANISPTTNRKEELVKETGDESIYNCTINTLPSLHTTDRNVYDHLRQDEMCSNDIYDRTGKPGF